MFLSFCVLDDKFCFSKKMGFWLFLVHLTSYWCYYPHRSRDALSPVCRIFFCSRFGHGYCSRHSYGYGYSYRFITFINWVMSVPWLESGSTENTSIWSWEFPRAAPSGTPSTSCWYFPVLPSYRLGTDSRSTKIHLHLVALGWTYLYLVALDCILLRLVALCFTWLIWIDMGWSWLICIDMGDLGILLMTSVYLSYV